MLGGGSEVVQNHASLKVEEAVEANAVIDGRGYFTFFVELNCSLMPVRNCSPRGLGCYGGFSE